MIDYYKIFDELKLKIVDLSSNDTSTITSAIKNYFYNKFKEYYVAGANGTNAYLYDISVMPCNPLDIYNNNMSEYKIYLAIESELGGESASSSKNVEKNVIEDFFKIVQALSDYKLFIGVYSKSKFEETKDEALKNRILKIENINNKSKNDTSILVIMIYGDHQLGNSRQIKIVKSNKY